jgi:Na+-translocating ferredoxin:NAD+ oxidoreductase RNF subunit RnfB
LTKLQEFLPAANCGGCGFAGCRNFAEAIVKAESFEGLNCPVGGAELMAGAAKILGKEAPVIDPRLQFFYAMAHRNTGPAHRNMTVPQIAGSLTTFISVKQIAAMDALEKVIVQEHARLMPCILILSLICPSLLMTNVWHAEPV